MAETQWDAFLLIHKGNVDQDLKGYTAWADKEIAKLTGVPPVPHDPKVPYIPDDASLNSLPLALLESELARLAAFFTADQLTHRQYTALTDRISKEQTALNGIEQRLEDAKGAADRRRLLQTERENAYERAFQPVINEQQALEQLYSPLLTRLASSSGTLAKLGLAVRRIADVDAWAAEAEEGLLDRRKAGSFQGIGAFTKTAREVFLTVWETGSAADIRAAMTNFVATHWKNMLAHTPLHHQETVQTRMVKGLGCDRHGALPSLLPSEAHIFCWCGRWSDLRGGDSGDTIINRRKHTQNPRRAAKLRVKAPQCTDCWQPSILLPTTG